MAPIEARLTALEAGWQALADKDAIRECLYRYSRGIDRCDAEALRSAYWPDATDRHGPYQGSAEGFIDWALDKLPGSGRMVHLLGNIAIELRGEQAAVESYFQAFQTGTSAQGRPPRPFCAAATSTASSAARANGAWRPAPWSTTGSTKRPPPRALTRSASACACLWAHTSRRTRGMHCCLDYPMDNFDA